MGGNGRQPIPTPLPRVVVPAVMEQREVDFLVAGQLSSHDHQELNSRLTVKLEACSRAPGGDTVTALPTVFGASIQTAPFCGDDEMPTGCDCHR